MKEINDLQPDLETLVGLTEEDLKELESSVNFAKSQSKFRICGSIMSYDIDEINRGIDLVNSENYYFLNRNKNSEEILRDPTSANLLNDVLSNGATPRTNELLSRQGFKKVKRYMATREELKNYSKVGNIIFNIPFKPRETLVNLETIRTLFHRRDSKSIDCDHQIECIYSGNVLENKPSRYILTVYSNLNVGS